MGWINPQQKNIKSGIDMGEVKIIEGKNVIYMSNMLYEENEMIVKYLDKKYDEGWEIVSQAGQHSFGSLILHKKDRVVRKELKYLDKKYRVVRKEPGSKPLSKKESSVKTLL